jgi:hypothetical protein
MVTHVTFNRVDVSVPDKTPVVALAKTGTASLERDAVSAMGVASITAFRQGAALKSGTALVWQRAAPFRFRPV